MRLIITGLAILLIVALTAALAGPYFVDWNGQRAFVEARLSHALGQKVTIGGSIDVKLLPTPYLILDQAVIGGDDGPIRIGIRHLDLEFSVAPLLHGEFEVVDARLEQPTIRVILEQDRTLPALPMGPAFQADVRFDRVSVTDGTLAIADPSSGRTFVVDDLDFDADAPSLAGPFKVAGTAGSSASRTGFRLTTTTAEHGRARARLVVAETRRHAGLDLDGTVALTSAGRAAVRQSFDGTLTASGHLDRGTDKPLAWTLSGPLKADPARARLTGGSLLVGTEDAGLRLAAAGEADLGTAPSLHLDLTAKQLDIDRLSGAPVARDGTLSKPPAPTLPTIPALLATVEAATPPLPTALDVSVDAATWAGEALGDLALHVGLGGTAARRLQVAGDGPGGSHVGLDGTIDGGATPRFTGAVEISAQDAPHAAQWLAAIAPTLITAPVDVPFHTVKLAGRMSATRDLIEGTALALTLDRTSLTGSAHLATRETPKLTANLRAETLDLDTLPNLKSVGAAMSGLDLDLTLDAKATKVSKVGDGTLDAGRINLSLAKTGGQTVLRHFEAHDLGGASVGATGTLDPRSATFDLAVDAARLGEAAALVHRLAPGAAADAFAARASSLAPAKLTIGATLALGSDGSITPSRLEVEGLLDATRVDAKLAPDADATHPPGNGLSLAATFEAPRGDALLRQFGLPALPLDALGEGKVSLLATGRPGEPFATTLDARFGATRLKLSGRFALLSHRHAGSGLFEVESPDLSPLLRTLALAFPDMNGAIPATMKGGLALDGGTVSASDLSGEVGGTGVRGGMRWAASTMPDAPALTGSLSLDRLDLDDLVGLAFGPPEPTATDGAWSSLAFGAGLVDPPRTAVALSIKSMTLLPRLVAADATLDLGLARNIVSMHRLAARVRGGRVGADVTLRRDGTQGTLEGKVTLDHVGVDLPAVKATLDASLTLAGGGKTALGLVSSLAGSGTATLASASIADASPAALPQVFAQVEADEIAVDPEAVARALREAAGGPLDAGTKRFSLELAGGSVGFDPDGPDPAVGPVSSVVSGSVDLRHLDLAVVARETLHALPKDWSGPPPSVAYEARGAPASPVRSIDVSAFVDAVATRALARESARIEAYEVDVRERALFNQRLQSERRREQDRLKAEADARKAEADRKAKIEATRQEKLRADEAARQKAASDAEAARGPAPPSAPDPATGAGTFQTPSNGASVDPSAAGRY